MILTKGQEQGLKTCVERYRNREIYTVIAGYAGTGKTTLIQYVIAALGLSDKDVAYVAYTGKATNVLKKRGCANAMTAHQLLYDSIPKGDGTFFHKPKRHLPNYKLIVVDEISMLPKEMWDLLVTHRIHVIALGDPAQLPPIGEDNCLLSKPHVFLDEVMRQEEGSEIIRLTMDIRAGKQLAPFKGEQVQVLRKKDFFNNMLLWPDQVIVGYNRTRQHLNKTMRLLLYGTDDPEPIVGDRLICLKNNWEIANENQDLMMNGTVGILTKKYPVFLFKDTQFIRIDFLPDGLENNSYNNFTSIFTDYQLLLTGEKTINPNNWKKFKTLNVSEFDYAYAITCHKAQGDEYEKVLVFEEKLKSDQHQRWLYTAATRAKNKLVIILDN